MNSHELQVRRLLGNEIVDTYLGDEAGSHAEIIETYLEWIADPGATWNQFLEWLEGDPITPRWYLTVFVLGHGGVFGRAHSALQSRNNGRKQGGHGTNWTTFLLPEDAEDPYIGAMGEISWTWPEDWSSEQLSEANEFKSKTIVVAQGHEAKKNSKKAGN